MKKFTWLFFSSFGIMFAILSWAQESGLLSMDLGPKKGFLALFLGLFLYKVIPSRIE